MFLPNTAQQNKSQTNRKDCHDMLTDIRCLHISDKISFQSKANHPRMTHRHTDSGDRDTDPNTLIYIHDLDILKMHSFVLA